MVEYSGAGRRLLDYSPGGATGAVTGILGHTEIPRLRFGELEFEEVRAAVIEEMPALFDRPVAGILGIDVLQRADRLVMEFPPQAKGPGLLSLQARREPRPSSPRAGEVKFSILQHHLVVPVHVNAKPAYLVLDTGSPDPLLDVQTALDTGVASTVGSEREVGGLDGGKVSSSALVSRPGRSFIEFDPGTRCSGRPR